MMKQGINKDWTDAVREKTLSEGTVPPAGSWEAVGRRVRRAAALRRTVLSAVAAVPILALLLWAPWRKEELPPPQPVAWSLPAGVPDHVGDDRGPAPVHFAEIPETGRKPDSGRTPAAPEEEGRGEIPDQVGDDRGMAGDDSSLARDDTRAEEDDRGKAGDDEQQVHRAAPEPDVWLENPRKAERPRLALGLRAGAGTVRHTDNIAWQSAPYIAALTYLNTTAAASLPGVKSNTSNTMPYSVTANALYPEADIRYSHDLPVTLGLSVRLDLNPRFGLESGLEYTYLHSVEESVAGRLDQQLQFIGIPLRVDVVLWSRNRLGFYAGIGGKMEKCVSASLGIVQCEESRLQWSAEAFGGIQYRLGGHAHLYVQPELSWYFTRTDLVTYRTAHPLGLTLHAGLRFDL